MFGELERLALAVTTVSWDDARRVVKVANQQLSQLLGAKMVRLYWDKEAQAGALLDPIAFVNRTGLDDPRGFEIRDEPNGPLSWAYHTGRPLWLEGLEQETERATNKIGGDEVSGDYLVMPYPCSSLLVVPLRPRTAVRGIYSVELGESGRITEALVDVMNKLSWSLQRVLASADTLDYDTKQAGRAITKFLEDAQGIAIDPVFLTTAVRNCFVARTFEPEFVAIQHQIQEVLGGQGVEASSYQPGAGGHVVDEIIAEIRQSHLCIADLTAQNANVMFEVGIMVMLGKDVILLQDGNDPGEIPYDVAHRAVYKYEMHDEQLMTTTAAGGAPRPFEDVVRDFIGGLDYETGFAAAQPYRPGG